MAKRFSETKIWDDVWYQDLPSEWKLLWKYVCDKCDEAGIWKVNKSLAEFQLKTSIKWEEADKRFNDDKKRIAFYDGFWVINEFVPFQYGDKVFTSEHPFHKKIRQMLDSYNPNYKQAKNIRDLLTDEKKQKIFEKDKFICQWCNKKPPIKELVIDHFIPITLGGDNTEENLVTSCIRCNSYKWMFSPIEFLERKLDFINPTEKLIKMIENLKKIGYQQYPINHTLKEKEEEKDKVNKGVIRGGNPQVIPTIEEVIAYCKERNKGVDPNKWHNFYTAKGWFIGKNKMKDWRAAVRSWEEEKPKQEKPVEITINRPFPNPKCLKCKGTGFVYDEKGLFKGKCNDCI